MLLLEHFLKSFRITFFLYKMRLYYVFADFFFHSEIHIFIIFLVVCFISFLVGLLLSPLVFQNVSTPYLEKKVGILATGCQRTLATGFRRQRADKKLLS